MALVESGADADAAARPHGQRTTVVVHVDVKDKVGALHLGPLLSDADRRYLLCDATCEVWFERDGQPIGAGRTTRTISRRLRRALEHRHPTCAVPGSLGAANVATSKRASGCAAGAPTGGLGRILSCQAVGEPPMKPVLECFAVDTLARQRVDDGVSA